MARQIDAEKARDLLAEAFSQAEEQFREGKVETIDPAIVNATDRLFTSVTQAYREALIGCVIARIYDPNIDIHLPATEHGDDSFSGRSLADNVITPFLRSKAVPISASPYLSSLRGGAKFIRDGQPRIQRDQEGFDRLVEIVDYVANHDPHVAQIYLTFLLRKFVQLREAAQVPLKRIAKPNLEQFSALISGLLAVKSGGRFASFLAIAVFRTVSKAHDLGWEVEWQGINVADKASGAVGDITIKKNNDIILGVEVTERSIDNNRVTLVFDQKVSPNSLNDYLFITTEQPSESALLAARSYTAVGHEMSFVILQEWITNILSILGPNGRLLFQAEMIDLLSSSGNPVEVKVVWNEQMDKAIGVSSK